MIPPMTDWLRKPRRVMCLSREVVQTNHVMLLLSNIQLRMGSVLALEDRCLEEEFTADTAECE